MGDVRESAQVKPNKYLAKRAELTRLQREAQAIKRRINLLEVELNGQKPRRIVSESAGQSELPVTDHAVVRYLERVHGLSLDPLRKKILTAEVERAIAQGEDYAYSGDFVFPIIKKRVVTVLTKEMVE